jgi:hypothetical protein
MTRAEIIASILINLFVLVVGAASRPLFKKLWAKMNEPSPLTPQSRGQLISYLGFYEEALARLNHLATNTKDLFLYFMQFLFAGLCFSVSAALAYVLSAVHWRSNYVDVHLLVLILLLLPADGVCIVAWIQARKMSGKRIETQKARILTHIDEIRNRLNPPE